MKLTTCLVAVLVIVGLAWLPSSANGQQPRRYYQPPAGSTITPALEFTRGDTGPLRNPYYSFVQPQRQMQAGFSQLQQQLNRQNTTIDDLRTQLLQAQNPSMQPTGTGATFFNYSHYYSFPQSRR